MLSGLASIIHTGMEWKTCNKSVWTEWHLVASYYSAELCIATTDYTNVIVSVDGNLTRLGELLISVKSWIALSACVTQC
jgi:hypothetical protein